ncbi:phytanoyl-CoA dioxygenase family protein [Chromohalobacter nigrandesensis]|uniref:phytanoyl-CoA dioxygenase family protein n=1 Tax=Chromohalobacter nigrandesensis TaxID=119863 RepID=UPI001FF13E5B|nr:phytanoyl-CoA dioxygenase family protein [Chromohalobacter nigrandesensis]MCK0744666.1 phytanoyl-CoA dioxygenase family protein [Chromohalobacter nigrandesensis]
MDKSAQLSVDSLVSEPGVTKNDVNQFREYGFVKIKSLLTEEGVKRVREEAARLATTAKESGTEYGSTFNRLAYGLGDTELFQSLYRSANFRDVVLPIIGSPLIATESQCFELSPEKQGFEWHYDSISFRYIRPQDPGYSLWIALDPVKKEDQGGGMAYMPENIFSGRANFQLSSMLSKEVAAGRSVGHISYYLQEIYKTPGFLTDIFEKYKHQDDFKPGDALLFKKTTWHRSDVLLAGDLKARAAVTIRLLDSEARLDNNMFFGETESGGGLGLGANWGRANQATYADRFTDIEDGDLIRDSKFSGFLIQ